MIAARESHKEVVHELTKAGAQLDITNYEQMSAADVTLDPEIDHELRREERGEELAKTLPGI